MTQNTTEISTAVEPVHSNILMRLYYGEYSLARTFWGFCILLPIVVSLVVSLSAFLLFFDINAPDSVERLRTLMYSFIGLYLLMNVYAGFAYVGLWRAATKYTGRKLWAILAKIYIVLGVLGFIVNIFNIFSLPHLI